MPDRPDNAHIDEMLRKLKPNARDYLRTFYLAGKGAQFSSCAMQAGVSENTFSVGIHDLDQRFKALTGGVALLRRTATGWELTKAGAQYGERLTEQQLQFYEMVDEASESLVVKISLASNCWTEFNELVEVMANTAVTVHSAPVRSTMLHLHEPWSAPPETLARSHALYTTCQDVKDLQKDNLGRTTLAQLPATEVLVSRTDDFKLVVRKKLFGASRETVSRDELIDSGVSLLLPHRGAAVDYLSRLEPSWSPLRLKRHRAGSQLQHVRGSLLYDRYPRPAMIVHGPLEANFPDSFAFLSITDLPTVKAVTGFYRRQLQGREKPWPNETEEAWVTVWERASRLWPKKEVS